MQHDQQKQYFGIEKFILELGANIVYKHDTITDIGGEEKALYLKGSERY